MKDLTIFVIGYHGTTKTLVILNYYDDKVFIRPEEKIKADIKQGANYSNVYLNQQDELAFKSGNIENYGDFLEIPTDRTKQIPYILAEIRDEDNRAIGFEIITETTEKEQLTEAEMIRKYNQFANATVEEGKLQLDTTLPLKRVKGAYNKNKNLLSLKTDRLSELDTTDAYKPIKRSKVGTTPTLDTDLISQLTSQGLGLDANALFKIQLESMKQVKEIEELKAEILTLENQVAEKEKVVEQIRLEYQEAKAELNEKLENYETDIKRFEQQTQQMDAVENSYLEEIQSLKDKIVQLEEEKEELDEIQEQTQENIKIAEETVSELEKTIEEMGVKYNKLHIEKEESESKIKQLQEENLKIETLELAKSSLEKANSRLTEEYEKKEIDLRKDIKSEIERKVKIEQEETQQELSKLQLEIKLLNDKIEEEQEKSEKLAKEVEEQEEKIEKLEVENKAQKNTIKEKDTQIDILELKINQQETKTQSDAHPQKVELETEESQEIEEIGLDFEDLLFAKGGAEETPKVEEKPKEEVKPKETKVEENPKQEKEEVKPKETSKGEAPKPLRTVNNKAKKELKSYADNFEMRSKHLFSTFTDNYEIGSQNPPTYGELKTILEAIIDTEGKGEKWKITNIEVDENISKDIVKIPKTKTKLKKDHKDKWNYTVARKLKEENKSEEWLEYLTTLWL